MVASELRQGKVVAGFTLLSYIGSGVSATVWKARKPNESVVALKVPRKYTDKDTAALVRNHWNVAEAIGEHPLIGRVFELIEDNDHGPLLSMEYIPGIDLNALRRKVYLPFKLFRHMLSQAATAAEFVHSKGYQHNDLGDVRNIRVTLNGEIRLIDLGTSCRINAEGASSCHDLEDLGEFIGNQAFTNEPPNAESQDEVAAFVAYSLESKGSTQLYGQRSSNL